MIEISDKRLCTGCGACASICPHDAIALVLDEEGFWYPHVDTALCVDCARCEKVCHMLHPQTEEPSFTGTVFAACLKDRGVLPEVSSGGAAWALTQETIRQGGVVYGAVQPGLFNTTHMRAEELQQAVAFRRSKYQESNMGTIYRRVKADLDAGRNVLFTGTGCQVAGLYVYLGTRPAGLITCDVVCHGIPSLRMFKDYIDACERAERQEVAGIVYRDKSRGWKYNQIAIYLADGRVIKEWCGSHPYHSSYLAGLISRPSCEGCRYQRLSRVSDITLADFWKYQGRLCAGNEERGVSLVVCSTAAGRELLDRALPLLDAEQVPVDEAIGSCRHLTKPAPFHPLRNGFFAASRIVGFMASYRIYRICTRITAFLRRCTGHRSRRRTHVQISSV
ncbi:MAG TPA: (4Fe-4S)-binding protein [Planctomycetes bacterium]|nr:(4Fe-4S)-binding protein [Planctomycetota bacterium]